MPDVNTLSEFAVFLKEYGGWAFSIILMAAMVYLHRTTSALLEKRNNELKILLAECKSVIAENRIFLNRVEDGLDKSGNIVEKNTEVLNRVRLILEDLRS
jgi:hypothetical protein